ncbi:hypothetical protein TGPRC2_223470 [Toxoplasma gondii TgCatPRC2]|uniref:Uncharacterized protein n=5 Tax=Toxoplasma gondii TaxID=5811 RepID=A0A125YT59_TOXGV|nr:hypothetical protein TGME49_223470 [Toxoplasma gondii ME49]ESS32405.1 hypothetical protein TGVEG_223470 [Toxoplasma gondii VEG]KFG45850.1 hypothetical protein TGDOM2_223470 [Toxoplasma gondii GAB2-2007-GAL-DOM2]KYF42266.1 hypothetical protein TGARI_223470 [Toxoplasma gondii ARI]KYK71651.1 hypothetical protein TGPRC2_223470 [Toxoplasma gondii TgCatPRC2]EPT26857.1 hypothetical protein TGME49_223470 [Toxoplasma gondii ME49]|eukprot:XP_018635895.1 hypothetical protein TGME49_223470 [Toxoplasma gondii ME49]
MYVCMHPCGECAALRLDMFVCFLSQGVIGSGLHICGCPHLCSRECTCKGGGACEGDESFFMCCFSSKEDLSHSLEKADSGVLKKRTILFETVSSHLHGCRDATVSFSAFREISTFLLSAFAIPPTCLFWRLSLLRFSTAEATEWQKTLAGETPQSERVCHTMCKTALS